MVVAHLTTKLALWSSIARVLLRIHHIPISSNTNSRPLTRPGRPRTHNNHNPPNHQHPWVLLCLLNRVNNKEILPRPDPALFQCRNTPATSRSLNNRRKKRRNWRSASSRSKRSTRSSNRSNCSYNNSSSNNNNAHNLRVLSNNASLRLRCLCLPTPQTLLTLPTAAPPPAATAHPVSALAPRHACPACRAGRPPRPWPGRRRQQARLQVHPLQWISTAKVSLVACPPNVKWTNATCTQTKSTAETCVVQHRLKAPTVPLICSSSGPRPLLQSRVDPRHPPPPRRPLFPATLHPNKRGSRRATPNCPRGPASTTAATSTRAT